MADPLRYAFCEGVNATSRSQWHIRKLTAAGLKPSGGIDTFSLCGRIERVLGWDLKVKITGEHLQHTCSACVAVYLEFTGAFKVKDNPLPLRIQSLMYPPMHETSGFTSEAVAKLLGVEKPDVDRELSVLLKAGLVQRRRAWWPIGSPRTWWHLK